MSARSTIRNLAHCTLLVFLTPSAGIAQQQPGPAPSSAGANANSDTDSDQPQDWALHGQMTYIWQYHPGFYSQFQGAHSFDHRNHSGETLDATFYAGARPWDGAEFWVNLELDQGIAPSNTHGVAGYINGDGAKVGYTDPYARFQRVFFRQTIDLGGKTEKVDADLNQLGTSRTEDRLVFTIGKFDATDVFDTNKYAHDPRQDFLNWAIIDTGSYDYAADAWGYSYGATGEWISGDWTGRAGFFDLSTVPNSRYLTPDLSQYQLDAEVERRFKLFDRDGKIALTGFQSHGRMGSFGDAILWGEETGNTPRLGPVRQYRTRSGLSFNLEQALVDDVGLFARGGIDEDGVEPYDYTDIDRTLASGISVGGKLWGRDDDTAGIADVTNWIGREHIAFLNAGGMGIVVGDGKLPDPAPEHIVEAFYNFAIVKQIHLSADAQYVTNPAYNADRGPVIVIGGRLHAEI
jgi:high affinity Mn2+ porin